MANIKILPDRVVNKIAAGEVVERPESVVKELIENSIDAKADTIKVFLKKSGKREIKVIDNGIGMSYDDALLAFERHATSKIEDVKDIENICTLGFRGEALPSIASVSKVILKTAKTNENEGTIIRIEGGILKKVEKAALPSGTEITVSSLFFNTPARKKFLKSDETELSRIVRLVNSYVLANPHTAFYLSNDGKNLLSFSSFENLETRIKKILGSDFLSFKIDYPHLKVEVFLLPPEKALKSPIKQYFLLNGRFVRDKTISQSVYNAFKSVTSFFEGYPQGVIKLQILPELVDVNVHPSKLEVRFRNQNEVYSTIKEACIKALENREKPSKITVTEDSLRFFTKDKYSFEEENRYNLQESGIEYKTETQNYMEHIEKNNFLPFEKKSHGFRVLGQFQASYIIAEKDNSLYIIDQHVVHERILYEKALKMINNNKIEMQPLLIPVSVNTGNENKELLEKNRDLIEKSGFKFEFIDNSSVKITAYPIFLKQRDIEPSFLELLGLIIEEKERDRKELFKDIAATIGCKNAIKANTPLTFAEIDSLLTQLFECENPYYCPHGRPILIRLTLDDIEKLFKRK
ncbi:DNA mismatch repair protein MutL [Thermotomaculum hydrothermale]|uniref:DNA mismatch repair protein MutL n=1 Tax=Thermotomaculum hydrothermale TaxID=981385 RepID=A0A7R6PEI9_9BACT|nr:DNA mismatch repair endonuclease MutL [Thermotomaculum hydrothermale]BBB32269.1 DNA mismatch repair protein MutL [Thermotomaculum hydrothermale]